MDEINKKCQNAIDHQNTFFLSQIPGLNILISRENPLYVNQIFPKYRQMNFLQYSVAAKKPKSLKFLLNYALESCKLSVKKIIKPTQTPARDMNLIVLAVEFHSNACLKELADFILEKCQDEKDKFDFDIEDQFGETPLTKAIRDKNEEAVLILINQCHADLMHRADEKKSILRPLLPFLVFLLNYINKDDLEDLWDKINEQSQKNVMDQLKTLKFDENFRIVDENNQENNQQNSSGDELREIFQKKGLDQVNEFLISLLQIKGPDSITTHIDDSNTSTPQSKTTIKCCICNSTKNVSQCLNCSKFFCSNHMAVHSD